MRDYEALLLGSKMIQAVPWTRGEEGDGPGCALGMISVASGKRRWALWRQDTHKWWTEDILQKPCGCLYPSRLQYGQERLEEPTITGWFVHCFNEHVALNLHNEPKTIEQLADWLKLHEDHYNPVAIEHPVPVVEEQLEPVGKD